MPEEKSLSMGKRAYDGDPERTITRAEFPIDEVDSATETVWLIMDTDYADFIPQKKDGFHFDVSVKHCSPDSSLGKQLKELPDYDFVTCSLAYFRPSSDVIGWWEFTEIHELRYAENTEKNVFTD